MMKHLVSLMLSAGLLLSLGAAVHATEHSAAGKFSASFIQSWLCRDWTQERWQQEFAAAADAGMDALILQSVVEISHTQDNSTASKQDASSFSRSECYAMYPTALENLNGCTVSQQNRGDALGTALAAAKAEGMQLWIGTVSDDRWWNYGWGIPETAAEGGTYFEAWSNENAALCTDVITEIEGHYGDIYDDVIAGYYYVNEIWNIDAACAGTDDLQYAKIIGNNINATVQACGERPLMISPFFNPDLSDAEQYGAFWRDIFQMADFRTQDIFAHQNGGGRECTPEVIRTWAQALKTAADAEGVRFWLNDETFQSDGSSKPVASLQANYNATADLAEKHILFSWNHYYNPLVNAEFASIGAEFSAFALEHPAGDVNADGVFSMADAVLLQRWLMAAHGTVLPDWQAADLCEDGKLDVRDLSAMKQKLLGGTAAENVISVSTVDALKAALTNAKAGDTILLAPGTYECGDYGTKASIYYSAASGTEDAPITIKSADVENPAVLKGVEAAKGIVLYITGEYWSIENIICSTAKKGIILDKASHSVIRDVQVYDTGEEGIHIRDGSSYCQVLNARVHDTGLLTPKYGEAIYIGSAYSTTGYSYDCHYNLVKGCILGPNVTAEHIDIKEYTIGNIIEDCTMYGGGMTDTDSFLDIKGNETIVRSNLCYDEGNTVITDAFQVHSQLDGWGLENTIYGNTAHLTAETAYLVRSWSGTSCTVYENVRNPESSEYMYRAYSGSTMIIQ